MNITKQQLKQLIKEELSKLYEGRTEDPTASKGINKFSRHSQLRDIARRTVGGGGVTDSSDDTGEYDVTVSSQSARVRPASEAIGGGAARSMEEAQTWLRELLEALDGDSIDHVSREPTRLSFADYDVLRGIAKWMDKQ